MLFAGMMLALTACVSTVENQKEKEMIMDKTQFTFYNILPMSIGEEAAAARDMIEYHQRTGNEIVLYSMTLHPEGFPARKKADTMIASYRKLKAELAGSGVKLGVLLQSVLGHWPRTDKNEEAWTRAVDINGKAARFCPLDPDFQQYIVYFVTELAKEDPVFMLGDDDIRSYSPEAECFCHRHVALFNERTGKNFTSGELRQAVKDSKPGDEVFETFLQLQIEMVNGVAALIRKTIDSVNPAIPAGSCMFSGGRRFNNQVAKAFAGKNHPAVMRVCNANYMEVGAKIFPIVLVRSLALRAAHADVPVVLDEADTFPQTPYSRSATSMHAKLCTSIMAGMQGAKIWYVNAHTYGLPVNRCYTDILAKNRNYYQTLTREANNASFTGLIVPGHKNFPNWHITAPNEKFVEESNWAEVMCAVYGIPFYCSFELDRDGIYLLAGEKMISRFSDAELKQLLSGKVLIDGQAAKAITKRGFAEYLGVTAEDKEFLANREYYTPEKLLRSTKTGATPLFTDPAKDAEILTWYAYAPSSGSKELEKVAPATVLYRNKLGGTVCTTGFCTGIFTNYTYTLERKLWMLHVLEKINGRPVDFSVEHEQNFAALTRKNPAGETIMVLVNLNFDPVENLAIRCAVEPESICKLTPEGNWEKVSFRYENGVAITDIPVACYELISLKIK